LRLAIEILAENLKRRGLKKRHQKIMERIQCSLPQLLSTDKLNATERVAAGKYLAQCGDSRQQVLNIDAIQFCQVSKGKFYLDSALQSVSYSYAISRYPVTVAQFRQFVEEASYQPEDTDCLNGLENAPVVYVSWHDAIAFCKWLTKHWQEKDWLLEGWRVELPSEPEWEKAARGGLSVPVMAENYMLARELRDSVSIEPEPEKNKFQQRLYPWGDEINDERLNYQSNINQVSSVGCYPLGKSPYGCEEMSGNVREWTRSLYKEDYPETEDLGQNRNFSSKYGRYVLRGGAFSDYQYFVRCSARSDGDPGLRISGIGFRVVLSPLPDR